MKWDVTNVKLNYDLPSCNRSHVLLRFCKILSTQLLVNLKQCKCLDWDSYDADNPIKTHPLAVLYCSILLYFRIWSFFSEIYLEHRWQHFDVVTESLAAVSHDYHD